MVLCRNKESPEIGSWILENLVCDKRGISNQWERWVFKIFFYYIIFDLSIQSIFPFLLEIVYIFLIKMFSFLPLTFKSQFGLDSWEWLWGKDTVSCFFHMENQWSQHHLLNGSWFPWWSSVSFLECTSFHVCEGLFGPFSSVSLFYLYIRMSTTLLIARGFNKCWFLVGDSFLSYSFSLGISFLFLGLRTSVKF